MKWRRWSFIGHNFGDYKNNDLPAKTSLDVLSVTILETTKTSSIILSFFTQFYRSQFWRLQKPLGIPAVALMGFIGHNFGDYKNLSFDDSLSNKVLSVTILETTKTVWSVMSVNVWFYRSQFWRLQKQGTMQTLLTTCFIGHNFGDYKNS